jgi:hypothetical protein
MNKKLYDNNKPIVSVSNSSEKALKISANAILFLVGAWMVIKLSKEILKELEGMGL